MNNADIAGIVCILIGLLLVLPALYASPVFIIVSGAVVSSGIVLIVTAGNMFRNDGWNNDDPSDDDDDDESGEKRAKKALWVEVEEEGKGTTSRALEPPLMRVAL
jgi:hypothetical protein